LFLFLIALKKFIVLKASDPLSS